MAISLIQRNQGPIRPYDDSAIIAQMIGEQALFFHGVGNGFSSLSWQNATMTIGGGMGSIGGRQFSAESVVFSTAGLPTYDHYTAYVTVSTQAMTNNVAKAYLTHDPSRRQDIDAGNSYATELAISSKSLKYVKRSFSSQMSSTMLFDKIPGVAKQTLSMGTDGFWDGMEIPSLFDKRYARFARHADYAKVAEGINGENGRDILIVGEPTTISRPREGTITGSGNEARDNQSGWSQEAETEAGADVAIRLNDQGISLDVIGYMVYFDLTDVTFHEYQTRDTSWHRLGSFKGMALVPYGCTAAARYKFIAEDYFGTELMWVTYGMAGEDASDIDIGPMVSVSFGSGHYDASGNYFIHATSRMNGIGAEQLETIGGHYRFYGYITIRPIMKANH